MIPTLSKRERLILICTVALLFTSLVYAFILEPIITQWRQVNKEVTVKRLSLEKGLRLLRQKEEITQRFQGLSAIMAAEGGSQEEQMAKLFSEIETLARGANVHILGMKPLPVTKSAFYKKYTVEIDSQGSIEKLVEFLYKLQHSKQILRVEFLELNAKSGTKDSLKVTLLANKITLD